MRANHIDLSRFAYTPAPVRTISVPKRAREYTGKFFREISKEILNHILDAFVANGEDMLRELCRLSSVEKRFKQGVPSCMRRTLQLDDLQLKCLIDVMRGRRHVFLTGQAGSGKTHLLKVIINNYSKPSLITASTATAASLLSGQTVHSSLGIGLGRETAAALAHRIKTKNKRACKRIRKSKLLIVDEISMVNSVLFETIGEVIRLIREEAGPFGSMKLLLCGDFLQLGPVERGPTSLFESETWKTLDLRTHRLVRSHRLSGGAESDTFLHILNRVRVGATTAEDLELLNRLSAQGEPPPGTLELHSLNKSADAVNACELNKLVARGAESRVFDSVDWVENGRSTSMLSSILAPSSLILAMGARVMCLKNLVGIAIHNGSSGVVVHVDDESVIVRFDCGRLKRFRLSDDSSLFEILEDGEVIASRRQVPLRLAWASSIHKAQGQSINTAVIDFANVFAYGQAYTALSRLRCVSTGYLRNLNVQAFRLVDPSAVLRYG